MFSSGSRSGDLHVDTSTGVVLSECYFIGHIAWHILLCKGGWPLVVLGCNLAASVQTVHLPMRYWGFVHFGPG